MTFLIYKNKGDVKKDTSNAYISSKMYLFILVGLARDVFEKREVKKPVIFRSKLAIATITSFVYTVDVFFAMTII